MLTVSLYTILYSEDGSKLNCSYALIVIKFDISSSSVDIGISMFPINRSLYFIYDIKKLLLFALLRSICEILLPENAYEVCM